MWILPIIIVGVALGEPMANNVGNYTARAIAARCTGTPVLNADNGVGNAGTLEACAAQCEANRPTCEKFTFRGGQTDKCHYFGSNCNPISGSGVTLGTSFNDAIYAHNDDINAVMLMDFYGDVVSNTRCESGGRITSDQGWNSLRTTEACAKKCAITYKNDCTGFTYRTSGNVGNPRCFYHNKECRRYRSTSNFGTGISGYNSYWFKGDTLQHYEGSVPSTVRDRLKDGFFQAKEYTGPCFAKSITYGGESTRKAYSRIKCNQNANNGVIYEDSNFPYSSDNGDTWRKCADLCVAWNIDSSNTEECRAFNKIMKSDNGVKFKCQLLNCGPYPRPNPKNSITVFNPSDSATQNDKWGFLDDATTPSCRGNFVDQYDQEIINGYDAYSGTVCSGTAISNSEYTTAIECAIKCATVNANGRSCVAFSFRPKNNKCHTWKSCELDTASSQSVQDVVYIKKFYLNHVSGDRRNFISATPGGTCGANPGAVISRTLTPGSVSFHYCSKECYSDQSNCEFFEFDTTTCKIWSDCGGTPQTDAAALGILYEPLPVGQTLPPSTQATQAPTLTPECSESSQCFSTSGDEICTKDKQCETVGCSSHEECFSFVRYGRLPLCDFKFGICRDYYTSGCSTARKCRSQARKKWKRQRSFARTRLKNQEERAEKRREFTLQAIKDLENAVNTSNSVYITVEGTEVVEINNSTMSAVNDTVALYDAMLTHYCGDAVDECSYNISGATGRRMLQDENVTLVITYEMDENLYQDLVNTGFDFDNENFTQAVADELGIDVNLVDINGVDGTIEIEVSIVDENLNGEPIGDSLINDISNIQDSLENITSTVIDEVGANNTQIDYPEIDRCGDRQCNNEGNCSSTTGFCSCNTGYAGINCEKKLSCADEGPDYCQFGGECRPDGMACHCIYPHYGVRCMEDPGACETCPGTGQPGQPIA